MSSFSGLFPYSASDLLQKREEGKQGRTSTLLHIIINNFAFFSVAVNTVRGVVNFGPRLTKKIATKVSTLPLKVAEDMETSQILSLLKTKAKEAKDITAKTISKVKTIPLKLKESLKGIKIVPNDYYGQHPGGQIPYQAPPQNYGFPSGWPNNQNLRTIESRLRQDLENIPGTLEKLKHNLDHFSRRIPNQMRQNIRNINIPDGLKPNRANAERLQHRLLATVEDAKTVGRKLSDNLKYADKIPLKENLASTEELLRTIPDQVSEDLEKMRNIPHHLRQNLESYKSIPYRFTKSVENMKSIPHLFWTKLGRADLKNSADDQQRITEDRKEKKNRLFPMKKEDRKMEEYFKKIIYSYLVDNDA